MKVRAALGSEAGLKGRRRKGMSRANIPCLVNCSSRDEPEQLPRIHLEKVAYLLT